MSFRAEMSGPRPFETPCFAGLLRVRDNGYNVA
jgi:hypothetical protein